METCQAPSGPRRSSRGLNATPPACLVCRSRKVKCDRSEPACGGCMRMNVNCPGYDSNANGPLGSAVRTSVEHIFRESGVAKRRVGSCTECRKAKARCCRTRPSCDRCLQKRYTCTYPGRHERLSVGNNISTTPPPSGLDNAEDTTAAVDSHQAPGEGRETSRNGHPGELQWLYSEHVPHDSKRLRSLIDVYFDRVHRLRCLGFIHKPSFLQSFDLGNIAKDYGQSLLYIMCAYAARCMYWDSPRRFNVGLEHGILPGGQWARTAREIAMKDLVTPSVQNLMSLILICEYGASVDESATTFLLLGCCYRLVRLLGLDSAKISSGVALDATEEESCRRLVWSCFILDSIVGSGVDGNLLWSNHVPAVPLPISDRDFIAQTPRGELTLLSFEAFQDPSLAQRLDVKSQIIYLISVRTKVLRLIRQTYPESICRPESPFIGLINQLELWYTNLPHGLRMTDRNIYIHKETNTLSSLIFLHITYNAVVFDLVRVSLPGFNFPLALSFQTAPAEFKLQCQQRCRYHADEVSNLIRIGLSHGSQALDDAFNFMAVYEATKIQIIHHTTVVGGDAEDRRRIEENIKVNIKLMNLKGRGGSIHIRPLIILLSRFGFDKIASEWDEAQFLVTSPQDLAEISGPADSNYLTSASTLRMAREEMRMHQSMSSPPTNRYVSDGYESSHRSPHKLPANNAPRIQPMPISAEFEMNSGVLHSENEGIDGSGLRGMSGYPIAYTAPSEGGGTMPDMPLLPSADDYAHLATEMSEYVLWSANEFMSLSNFQNS